VFAGNPRLNLYVVELVMKSVYLFCNNVCLAASNNEDVVHFPLDEEMDFENISNKLARVGTVSSIY